MHNFFLLKSIVYVDVNISQMAFTFCKMIDGVDLPKHVKLYSNNHDKMRPNTFKALSSNFCHCLCMVLSLCSHGF